MKKVHFTLLMSLLLVFLMTLIFFIMLLQLIDLFGNLWGYIDNHVSFLDVAWIMILYIPKCLSYAIPVALLFSISFTLGTMYSNNELIAVFGGGMSLFVFVMPLLIMGVLLSAGVFFFEENVVIQTIKMKVETQAVALKQPSGKSQREIGFIDKEKDIVVKMDSYIPHDNMLTGVTIFYRQTKKIIYADSARWNQSAWILSNCYVYEQDDVKGHYVAKRIGNYTAIEIRKTPENIQMTVRKVEEMDIGTAAKWIDELKESGLPSIAAQTDFFNKFSYALRVFIVTLIAVSIGGAFKKNIMLMCLLVSLGISVIFFVFQLISDAFAKNGFVPPVAGAFLPILVFLILGVYLVRRART
ncbi:MAG: LptF/LptG family permease [Spirochaetales bacterium]|nr:LptF/LptG family permease [Spirochaetales bacterium]